MGDRRPAFSFRSFWSGGSSRRPPATQAAAAAPPPATTTSSPTTTPTAEPQPVNRQSYAITPDATSTTPPTTPPTTATQTSGNQSTTKTSQPTTSTFTSPTDEPKTSSPSSATTQSPSSSPSHQIAQSRSPPQPPSPSRGAPQTRSTPPSPSRGPPQARSAPPSPSRAGSKTPQMPSPRRSMTSPSTTKHTPSTSPKESNTSQENSISYESSTLAPNEKEPKPSASEQEPRLKAEAKSDHAKGFNDQTHVDGTVSRQDHVEVMPSKSSEHGTTTAPAKGPEINGGHGPHVESNAKPEESKDVKEVVQARNTKANEETKKNVDHNFLAPKSGAEAEIVEKAEIPSKLEHINTEKREAIDTNQILAASLPNAKPTHTKASESKKRSRITSTHDKNIKDEISTFVNKMSIGDPKSTIYDRRVSVITLAGENRGASMQMGSDSSRREGPVHIHRNYKIDPDESAGATTDGEGSSKGKKRSEDANAIEDQPTEAYVNNNAQGINNSIVLSCSVTERNPGVHMVVSHVQKEPIQSTETESQPETRKAEFKMSRAEKLTYEPTVRRRCLRGLLLETSDSDPENPKKPRRHGCRVGCQQKDKENDIDVL